MALKNTKSMPTWDALMNATQEQEPALMLKAMLDHLDAHSSATSPKGQDLDKQNPGSYGLNFTRLIDTPAGVLTVKGPLGWFKSHLAEACGVTDAEEQKLLFDGAAAELVKDGYAISKSKSGWSFFRTPNAQPFAKTAKVSKDAAAFSAMYAKLGLKAK